ncbi:MAG TPA: DUF1592 domain-containing protein [Bryobacteraceae bacterium]
MARAGEFQDRVFPIFKDAGCPACHNTEGVASGTRLQFPDSDAAADRMEAFGKYLVVLVDRKNPSQSLLLNKPTKRVAHGGGERIKPGSPQEAILKSWIQTLAAMSDAQAAAALKYRDAEAAGDGRERITVVLRRLTNSQYNNTVRDLLGDLTGPSSQFPPEDYVNGFKDQYQAQSLTPVLLEAYSAAAERLAGSAFRGGDTRGLIPCKPSPACRETFVRSFGLKAFRRPLEPSEVKRYAAMFAGSSDFLAGAQLAVEAMLQSPNFLFRLEDTQNPAWKPYASASRISYALWDSMPDAELLAAAGRGELATPQGVQKAVRRMLDDPRAHQAFDEFVSQWMRFDRLLSASKDRRKYPQFTREAAVAMTEETRLFLSDLVWNNRDFMGAFTADYGFVNGELASIYGLAAPAKEFDRVQFPPESERAGLLGQATFLALTAKPEDTSPTARGLFVREQFLCQHVSDPPPGVNTNLPPVTEAKPQTNRDRMSVHLADASCATCHNLIDPIGYGFEKFDAIGGRREKMKLTFGGGFRGRGAPGKTIELDLDTTGGVAGIADSKFTSPRELGAVLARTPQCQECLVKQYFRYVAGRLETAGDRPLINKVTADFRRSQFRFQQLIGSLVLAREFPPLGGSVHAAGNY